MAGDTAGDTVSDELMMSRVELLDAADAWVDESDPELAPGAAWLVIVANPKVHLLSTVASAGELRRAEVWMSGAGVVAIAHQASDDTPTAVVALPPQEAFSLVASTASLSLGAVRGTEAVPVPEGLYGIVERVVASDGDDRLVVIDWTAGDESSRWVVLDVSGARTGTLDAPSEPDAALTLDPLSPMELLTSLSDRVAAAIAQEDD